MATLPPADRTSPLLDPRYDPVYQRGYSADGAPARRPEARARTSPVAPAQAPASKRDLPSFAQPVGERQAAQSLATESLVAAPAAGKASAPAPGSFPPGSFPPAPFPSGSLPPGSLDQQSFDEHAADVDALERRPSPPQEAPAPEAAPAARGPRLGTSVLWAVSAALITLGFVLYFTFAAAGYGADWSVSSVDGSIRFADGRSVEQVLATQLAVTIAPYLIVLGLATAVATLFLHVLRSERGTR